MPTPSHCAFAALLTSRRLATTAVTLLLALSGSAAAQEPVGVDLQGYVTRAELEAYAVRVERAAAQGGGDQQRAEAAALRERLREGDFKPGDRIVLSTVNSLLLPEQMVAALNDTLVVRQGLALQIPGLKDLSLAGVLRSELQETVRDHVEQTLRNPSIRADVLMQVQVSGPVGRPGFYSVSPDLLVSDAIMHAGGPAGSADVSRTVVKRAGEEVIGRDSLQAAIRGGATLDRIDLRAGDEIAMGERRRTNWQMILQVVGVVSSVTYLVLRFTR